MSHFVLAVFTDGTKTVEELLKPYDENMEVEPYIGETKAEIIEEAKEMKNNCLKQQAEGKRLNTLMKEYINAVTDEQLYQCKIYDDEIYDTEGNRTTTYNPNSKWDWYEIGGRWKNELTTKCGHLCDSAKVSEVIFYKDFSSFAVLLPNGEWCEKGKMGWWGAISDEKEDWKNKYKERFIDTAKPDWTLTIVDCHI